MLDLLNPAAYPNVKSFFFLPASADSSDSDPATLWCRMWLNCTSKPLWSWSSASRDSTIRSVHPIWQRFVHTTRHRPKNMFFSLESGLHMFEPKSGNYLVQNLQASRAESDCKFGNALKAPGDTSRLWYGALPRPLLCHGKTIKLADQASDLSKSMRGRTLRHRWCKMPGVTCSSSKLHWLLARKGMTPTEGTVLSNPLKYDKLNVQDLPWISSCLPPGRAQVAWRSWRKMIKVDQAMIWRRKAIPYLCAKNDT